MRGAAATAVSALCRDCHDSWRNLRGSPGFTAMALGILALGLGLNTAFFSVVNAVLLRPLPVRDPHDLAFVWRAAAAPAGSRYRLGRYEDVRRFVENEELFSGGAGYELDTATLRVGSSVAAVTGERVSPTYFDVLGVAPILGRTLVPSDAEPGADRVIVLSHALWRSRFNADPAAIGQRVSLGTSLFMSDSAPSYTIVGVVVPAFTGVLNPSAPTDYWVEFSKREEDTSRIMVNRTIGIETAVVRRRADVSLEQVRAFAGAVLATNAVEVRPDPSMNLSDVFVSETPEATLPFGAGSPAAGRLGAGLMLVATLVLAIGAANLAGLVMARGVARRRDVAIRLALGASHWRIARQLLVENVAVAAAGGLVGLILSRLFVKMLLDNVARGFGGQAARMASLGVPVDGRVLLFATILSVVTGLAIGVAAVRRSRHTSLLMASASDSLGAPTVGRTRRRHWILVPQLAFSLALLLVSLVAVRALLKVALVPSGYEPDRAAFVTFEPLWQPLQLLSTEQKAAWRARLETLPRRLLELGERTHGLEAVALARRLPTGQPSRTGLSTSDLPGRGLQAIGAESAHVTAGYFRALGIPMLRGRVFNDDEVAGGHAVAVVDQRLADRLWPGLNPIGQLVAMSAGPDKGRWHEVIGVVGAVRGPLSEGETHAIAYFPWPKGPQTDVVLVGRGRGTNAALVESLRALVRTADASIGVLNAGMISDRIDEHRYPRRLVAEILGLSAIGGLLLAAAGLYGVLSYAVSERTREIGIRAALGATRRDVALLVVTDAAVVAGVGSAVGIPLAMVALGAASHYVLPLPPLDAVTLAVAPLVVLATALAASYLPARRAARVNPIEVLRAV